MDKDKILAELKEFFINDISKKDYVELLKYHRKYLKLKDELVKDKRCIKLAVLGSKSIQFFVSCLEIYALSRGIYLDIYEGEYDGINSEILDPNSRLYSFRPEFVFILNHYTDIKDFPELLSSDEELKAWASKKSSNLFTLFEKIQGIGATVFYPLFVSPIERQFDQLEESIPYSRRNAINLLNSYLIHGKLSYVHYIDLNYIAEYVGKANWFDERNYYLNKAGFSYSYLPLVSSHYISRLESLLGRSRKCIVLDLDNTLWGGVVGDLGYDGINLNPNDAVGECFLAFQEYLLSLRRRGVILAVCSKNDDDVAKEAFEKNEFIKIRLSDIACFKANWNDKASNIKEIASELNIGTDSLVFVDDNPAEREIVKRFLPEVKVIELSEDPALYIRDVNEALCFDWAEFTKEDITRVDSYQANQKREALLSQFVDYSEYLKSLEMKGSFHIIKDDELERYVQLTNKSNQFNLRTKRLTEAETEDFLKDGLHYPIAVVLEDCFSNYGLISCILLKKEANAFFIENWLMSCRVLKRGVEDFALNKIVELARNEKVDKLVGEYIKSPKNKMVEDFYIKQRFSDIGDNKFVLDISSYEDKLVYIEEK